MLSTTSLRRPSLAKASTTMLYVTTLGLICPSRMSSKSVSMASRSLLAARPLRSVLYARTSGRNPEAFIVSRMLVASLMRPMPTQAFIPAAHKAHQAWAVPLPSACYAKILSWLKPDGHHKAL